MSVIPDIKVGRVTPCAPSPRSSTAARQQSARSVKGKAPLQSAAFTLIEMLVVIAIIGIIAAITVPALRDMQKSDAIASATRQMQDALARARQFAISQRSTVYLVFLPRNFWNNNDGFPNQDAWNALSPADKNAATQLLDKQMVGYNFISVRDVGDQPGQKNPRYLDEWRTLPEGIFIPEFKFLQPASSSTQIFDPAPPLTPVRTFDVRRFAYTNSIPFPSPEAAAGPGGYVWLPYIAFNHLGQLMDGEGKATLEPEMIPLARGTVAQALDRNKKPIFDIPEFTEKPPGNSTNAFTLVVVDGLTGRAHVERQQIQ